MSGNINAKNITSENITVTNLTVTNINGRPYAGSNNCGSYYTPCPSCDDQPSEEPCTECGSGEVDPCDCFVPNPCIGPLGVTGAQGSTGAPNPNATAINISNNNTNATFYPTFVSGSGNQTLLADISIPNFTLNPSTGNLTATTFSGSGSGLSLNTVPPTSINYFRFYASRLAVQSIGSNNFNSNYME